MKVEVTMSLHTQVQTQMKIQISEAEKKAKEDLARARRDADRTAFFEVLREKGLNPKYTFGNLLEDTARATKLRGYLKEMSLAQLVEVLSPAAKKVTTPTVLPTVSQREKLMLLFLSDPAKSYEIKNLIIHMGLDRNVIMARLGSLREAGKIVLENGMYRLNTAPAREFIVSYLNKNGLTYPSEIIRHGEEKGIAFVEEVIDHLVVVGTLIQYASKEVNLASKKR